MRKFYWSLILCSLLASVALEGSAQAECRVRAPATYTAGEMIYSDVCSTNNGAKPTELVTQISGERLVGLAGKDYLAVRNEANVAIISKTTAVTIGAGAANDTHLLGLLLTAALTGTCAITGFADSDGAAQTYTLPAATTAGYKDFLAAKNSAGALTITCSNAGDDNLVMVFWRPAI